MASAPDLTVAILHHHLRGYPADCLESLLPAPHGTEFLLLQTDSLNPPPLPGPARLIPVPQSVSRAAAKNLALAEARGEFLLFVSADVVARPGSVECLRRFLSARPAPAAASAQLLSENGTPRRTSFPLPSIARELRPFRTPGKPRRRPASPPAQPSPALPVPAAALHAAFLMARRETFRAVGGFAEGYRFAFEDLEWSWRAREKGVELFVCPASQAFKLAPQLRGLLAPEIRAEIESSRLRLVRAVRGPSYARAFRALRRSKSLAAWLAAASLNRLLCGNSLLLANRAAAHRAIWRIPPYPAPAGACPPDVESRVTWEMSI